MAWRACINFFEVKRDITYTSVFAKLNKWVISGCMVIPYDVIT